MLVRNPRLTLDEARRGDPSYRTLSQDHLALLLGQAIEANSVVADSPSGH
jgi:hypothetical protein